MKNPLQTYVLLITTLVVSVTCNAMQNNIRIPLTEQETKAAQLAEKRRKRLLATEHTQTRSRLPHLNPDNNTQDTTKK